MKLNKFININMHFQNSINLSLDLNNIDKINGYIPTDSGITFFNYYLDSILKPNSDRSTMMIAPYGKGKSHAILVLLSLLSLTDFTEIEPLLSKIKNIDEQLYLKIKKIENKQYMPVIISNTRGSLSQALASSLKKSLQVEELTDITLDSEFSEAIKRMNAWKSDYPGTYEALKDELKKRKLSINSLINQLNDYDEASLDLFKEIHRTILSGAQFVSDTNIEVVDYYHEVSNKIVNLYGYAGMYIVFDEFTKFLESRDVESVSNDMKIIQDFAELANSSQNQEISFQLVLHKPVSEYESLPKIIKNAFKGIEGRVSPYYFTASVKNSFDLISNVLEKNSLYVEEVDNLKDKYNRYLLRSLLVPGLSLELEDAYLNNSLIDSIFPLHPLTAYMLIRINEKVAQNERTLFTFLAKDSKNTLVDLINKDLDESYILPFTIFDYFEKQLLEERDNIQLKKIANSAISALSSTNEKDEQKFIKTLALILMINDRELLPSNISVIKNANFLSDDEANKILKSLISKNILTERAGGIIEFKVNIGFNIEKEIANLINRRYATVKVTHELNERNQNKYVYPKLYNTINAITRYFVSEFIDAADFCELENISYFFDDDLRDGLILNVIPNNKVDYENVLKKVEELNCERLVVVYPKRIHNYTKTLQWLLAIEYLQNDEEFQESHNLISTELSIFHDDYVDVLVNDLAYDYGLDSKNNYLINTYHKNELNSKMRNISKNRVLGEILAKAFYQYPIVNLEMLNRWNVKGTYKKARIEVDDLLLGNNYDYQKLGTSPKDTIINCVLLTTGILNGTPNEKVLNVLNLIEDFFRKESGNFADLYQLLIKPPFGLRSGIIPVLVSYVIGLLPYTIIIKKNGLEQQLSAVLIDDTIDTPNDFEFQIDKVTEEKQLYLDGLAKLFNTKFDLTISNPYENLYLSIRKWYLSLPRLTKDMIGKDDNIRNAEFKSLKKICNAQNVNASDFILEMLPNVTKEKDKLRAISKIKQNLDLYIDNYKNQLKGRINTVLGYAENTNVVQSVSNWYVDNFDAISSKVLDSAQRQFITLCQSATKIDELTLINKIAYIYINLFVEDWSSNTVNEFESEFVRLNNLLLENNETSNSITIQIGDQIVNKVFDNDDNPVSQMVQERIIDAISDFGELLSDEEKIALLVKVMEKYL